MATKRGCPTCLEELPCKWCNSNNKQSILAEVARLREALERIAEEPPEIILSGKPIYNGSQYIKLSDINETIKCPFCQKTAEIAREALKEGSE